ncbi:ankyrin repeat domain-containing protein [Actinoplanes subglobosus]|uniref:Ankyrin repeat domain-containing protein n=1 Tax=Actinoplanes subglobosus TaxID=1547892 RepID=A0ABV8IQ58_9ACTN
MRRDLFLSDWRQVRRYAVPARMIAACTDARERGDWRAACAAARIDVDPGVTDDAPVAHLAPDLLRWHLPRALHGSTAFTEGVLYLLIPDEPVGPETVLLTVRSPDTAASPQRLRLGVVRGAADLRGGRAVPVPAYLWDARHTGGLRAALGGSADRLPLLTATGEAVPEESLGLGDDLAARAERVWRAPTRREAFAAAGFEFAPGQDGAWRSADHSWPLQDLDPLRLAHETRWLAARLGERTWVVWQHFYRHLRVVVEPGDVVRISLVSDHGMKPGTADEPPGTRIAMVRFAADLELIRQGRLKPGALHPLVRDALFPGAPADLFRPTDGELVRVRCNGVWHEIEARLGRLDPLAHTVDERQRERAMRAFGGAVTGCFAVEQLWYGALGRLPRQLRAYRNELWQHLVHGGTDTLLELLDTGLDPHLRDSAGGTLIHRIAAFDHRELLPRLLAAGVGIDTVDKEGNSALHRIVVQYGPADVITTLVDAGANPRIRNRGGHTVLDHAKRMAGYDRLRPDFRRALDHLRKHAR